MDVDKFINIDLNRDLKILLAHYKHHLVLGQKDDDILNAVFVGSLVKGRLLLDMLGIKANSSGGLHFDKEKNGDINAKSIGGRFASPNDLKNGEENMLCNFLTSVNKAEAHRNGYDQNNDNLIHPSILTILRLVNTCIYQHSNKQISYDYASQILNK